MNREVHIKESLYVCRWREGGEGEGEGGNGKGGGGSDNNHRENLSTVQGS